MKVCILIPAHNCAHILPKLLRHILDLKVLGPQDEIIVVDDFSSDGTQESVQGIPQVAVYRNSEQKGYGGTSQRLYQLAALRDADLTVNIHGDYGHQPENIGPLLDRLKEGGVDIVLGSRLVFLRNVVKTGGWQSLLSAKNREGMPLVRVAGHFGLTAFQNYCFGTKIHSFHEGMRGCNRRAIDWILNNEFPVWYNYDTTLLVRAHHAGLKIEEVPIRPQYQHAVKSSAPPFRYGMRVLKDSLRLRSELRKARKG